MSTQRINAEVCPEGGAPREVNVNISPWRSAGGSLMGAICVFEDINEIEKRVAAAERVDMYLSELFDRANAPIFAIDLDLNITEWNFRMHDLTGQAREEVMGRSLMDLVQKDSREHVDKALVAVVAGEVHGAAPFRMQLKPSSGEKCGATLLVGMSSQTSGKDDGVIGALCVGQVVPLEAEAAGAAAEPAGQGDPASKSAVKVDAKTKGMVMHELRSPLHGIIGLATTLAQDKSPMQKALNMISSSAERVLELVTNVMDYWAYSQEECLEDNAEPIDVSALITECVSKVKELKDKRGKPLVKDAVDVRQEISSIPSIKGDHQGVSQMVYHLLQNAFKFTSDGHVKIFATSDDSAETVTIAIEDTGIGVMKAKLSHIFEPFQQQDSSESRKYEGIGLGLSIVAEVCRIHGGSVDVQSTQGSGSTFSVRLPFRPKPPLQAKPQVNGVKGGGSSPPRAVAAATSSVSSAARSQSRGQRPWERRSTPSSWLGPPLLIDISRGLVGSQLNAAAAASVSPPRSAGSLPSQQLMVQNRPPVVSMPSMDELPLIRLPPLEAGSVVIMSVDDDHVNQEVMRSVLEPCGYTLVVCMNGNECLERLDSDPLPDLVLLDLMMPGITGFDVLQAQRKKTPPERLPIIMVSAKNQTSSVVKGLELGCNDWIHKPFDRQELIARVRYQLFMKRTLAAYANSAVSQPSTVKEEPKPTLTAPLESTALFLALHVPEGAPSLPALLEDFETLSDQLKVTRTEMIGHCYLAVMEGKVNGSLVAHADIIMRLGLGMEQALEKANMGVLPTLQIRYRIGIHTDNHLPPVIMQAKQTARQYPASSFFGPTVRLAKLLGERPAGTILISPGTRRCLSESLEAEARSRGLHLVEVGDMSGKDQIGQHYCFTRQPASLSALGQGESPALGAGPARAGEVPALRQQLLAAEMETSQIRRELSLARADARLAQQRAQELQSGMRVDGVAGSGPMLRATDPQADQCQLFLQWHNGHLQVELRHCQMALARSQAELKMQAKQNELAERHAAALKSRLEHLELDKSFRTFGGLPREASSMGFTGLSAGAMPSSPDGVPPYMSSFGLGASP